MKGSWTLQGNTTITNVKLILTNNYDIYANGYNLVLGTKDEKESLKIVGNDNNEFYPNVYGGSSTKALTNDTNLTINAGNYNYIFGGSKNKTITGNVNLTINYAAVAKQAIYGGADGEGATITGSTIVNIKDARCDVSIYGGSKYGTITKNVDMTVEYVEVVGSIYGGSNKGTINGNVNLEITGKPKIGTSIYGGSNNSGTIKGNTNLKIADAEVNTSIYGGSKGGSQTGTATTIIQNGQYGLVTTANGTNETTISGGSNGGSVGGVSLTINDATIANGCVTGAGNSAAVYGTIDINIEKITLNTNNSIYGYGYTGGTTGSKDITMTIGSITGKPKYIMGYCYSGGGAATGTITMNLSNINSTNMEVYGGSYNGIQTAAVASKITTNNVKAKLLSPGGIQVSSIKSYNITVNGGSFSDYIYAGIGTNEVADVVNDGNALTLNSYNGKISVRNKTATLTLNNSNVTAAAKMYYSNVALNNSVLSVESIYYTTWSLGNIVIDENSEFSINNTKQLVVYGTLSGKGVLRLCDTTSLTLNQGLTGPIKIDIIEDANSTNHYVNIISQNEGQEDENELISVKEIVDEQEVDKYKRDFINSISYWKFYTEEGDLIEGQANCVYLDSTNGNDSNPGTIKEPVKTIQRASEIIKSDSSKDRAVIISDLNLNQETSRNVDTSDIYTLITTTDGKINFQKEVNLNATDSVNNIYQNIKFENLKITNNTSTTVQNIFLNGNKLIIGSGVTTNVNTTNNIYISIYGGANTTNLENVNTNIQINSGTWYEIYGGSNTGEAKGNTNIVVNAGTIYNIYGGNNKGKLNESSTTNVTINGGSISTLLCGGSKAGDIIGNTNVNIKGSVAGAIYGGNYSGAIIGNTYLNITSGIFSNNMYAGNYNGKIIGTTNLKITNGTIKAISYGGSYKGNIEGTTNVIIEGGTISTTVYGGSREGNITGNTNFELKKGTVSSLCGGNYQGTIEGYSNVKVTGGTVTNVICTGSNKGAIKQVNTTEKATKLEITGGTISGRIYGGSYEGAITGDICLKISNITFNKKTELYRGNKSGALNGNISSDISNIYFTTTDSIFCSGSNDGSITGNLELKLVNGTFKNNTCNAIVYGGSISGKISGNLDVEMSDITFASEVYGGSKTGLVSGDTTFNVDGIICNSNLYGIGKLGLITGITEANTNTVEIKNSTVKGKLYAVNTTESNILAEPNITIDNVQLEKMYAFKSFTSMNKELNITLSNSKSSNGIIEIDTVESNASTDLTGVLTLNSQNNISEIYFLNGLKANSLNITNSKVTAEKSITVNDLSLIENGTLDLKKASTVKNTFTGATNTNYGVIEVYEGLDIGAAIGSTTLDIGTITQKQQPYSDDKAFIGDGIVRTETTEKKTWTVGSLNALDVVYLGGAANGNDGNSGQNASNALATLKRAYYYCKDGGIIVICGPVDITEWPDNASKLVTITSKYGNEDYISNSKLTLNCSESSISLQKKTIFKNLKISVSKTQNIYANGNELILGNGLNIENGSTYLNIYGGAATSSVSTTNLTINSGSYNNIYGGGIGTTGDINVNIAGGNINSLKTKYASTHTSNGFKLYITNATVTNVYYEPDKTTNIILESGANVTNINAETYSANNANVTSNINVNTTNSVNIDGKSKGNTNVNFSSMTLDNYSGSIKNIAVLNIENSQISYTNSITGITKFNSINSTITIGDKVTSLTLGTVNFDNTSTIKVLSSLKTIRVTGNFSGGGNIYLNDGIRLEISGKVTNSTKVYCNNKTEYFANGTMIIATASDDTTDTKAFITPDGENWYSAGNEGKRIWQTKDFAINHIIYVNSTTGSSYGLGTKDTPVDTLETAYKIANKRYAEDINQSKTTKYYIVLQENLTLTSTVTGTKLDENIEVVITNTADNETVKYNTALNINTSKFDFVGKTTIENISINTNGYTDGSVEFFANGNNVKFGNGITINSPSQKYPIIYGASENSVINNEINLTVLSGTYNMIFGGGKKNGADVTSNINLTIGEINLKGYGDYRDDDEYTGLFGAGRNANVTGNVKIAVNGGDFHRIYGAGLNGTLTGDANIEFNGGTTKRLYGGGQRGEVFGSVKIKIASTVTDFLRGSGQYIGITGSTEVNIYSGAVLLEKTQVAAGGYQGNVATSKLNIYGGTIDCDLYGGGWGIIGDSSKGTSENTEVYIHQNAEINGDVYGGGYAGPTRNTNVTINEATVKNVYGGGNEAEIIENTNVRLTNANITESAYGGGKGATATVKGNSTVIIDGKTVISENIFGGGNASMTGLIDKNSTTNVYIVGGTVKIKKDDDGKIIGGDVYGGANTSIVYGSTNVKIGKEAVQAVETINIEDLKIAPINIQGTIFGGGKSNAAGSEDYDFTFESVTGDVNIDINSKDIELNIGTSIFASGNAAKISGNGYVKISNYGTYENPKQLTSIQRASEVTIDNSTLWILGTTDRTNEISTIKYTINRVEDLKLKNNSTLYLENGVNIVEKLESLDIDGNLEYVRINEDETINQNVNNKIFLLHGKNIILLAEDGSNGSVYGMTFLGKYDSNKSTGTIERGIYSYNQNDYVDEEVKNKLAKSSYLQAQHYTSHDITKDGFYTNKITEESTINVQYITPTPEDATYYQWSIGKTEAIYYGDIELIASKYSSTAQVTLDLVGLNAPDMILDVKNIDTSLLDTSVILKDEAQIPNIAEDAVKANSEFALTMENGYQGWKANGKTNYLYQHNTEYTDENKFGIVQGTTSYYADKSSTTPTLTFNLAHSKNISEGKELGKVTIKLVATYVEDDASISRDVIIELILRTAEISTDIEYYEGAITPGLKYRVFPSSTTNITSKSAISTYYSIYLGNYNTENYYENYEGYYHALNSSFVLPKGTKIVIIDKSSGSDKYYYYIVTAEDEQSGKMLYKFTDFTTMGTLDEKYNSDSSYYNQEKNYVLEEFIVQLNFENTIVSKDYSRESLKIQLMDTYDDSVRLTVNDAIYPMMYNIYCNQEPDKLLTIEDKETVHMYEPKDLDFNINANYIYQIVNSNVVYDTTNFDNAEGLKATFYLDGEQLTKEELGEISITHNEMPYFVNEEGAITLKIADVVSNLETKIRLNLTAKENWEPGTYTMRLEAIASADGINSSNSIASDNVAFIFSSSEYGLDVTLDSNSQIIDKAIGNTLSGNNILDFKVEYASGLANPKIRVALYRRNYENIYSSQYNLVDLKEFVIDNLKESNNEKEYIVTDSPKDTQEFTLNLKNDGTLTSGTYKVKFLVYDGDNYIGEVYKMIIIK